MISNLQKDMEKPEIKMVIVIRKDLKMSKGQVAAMASHACMKIFFDNLQPDIIQIPTETWYINNPNLNGWIVPNRPYFEEYINGSFVKIVVGVNSLEELQSIYEKATQKKIHASLIKDSTLQDYTAVAIGPWKNSVIDEITGHLPLL